MLTRLNPNTAYGVFLAVDERGEFEFFVTSGVTLSDAMDQAPDRADLYRIGFFITDENAKLRGLLPLHDGCEFTYDAKGDL
ncbi:MAG: hypothetical protein C4542_08010 [Dehalococcoidia bacterium]|nr:MAG: hypothetical protein C4542_08010 [Dehalococcoidia bacterium]